MGRRRRDSAVKGQDGPGDWLGAEEASALLGVKRETLYAYASRGKVRSRPFLGSASSGTGGQDLPGRVGGRHRQYLATDLQRLLARREARSGHRAVAAGALRWGEPVLDSAITDIRSDGPWYRGVAAVELASTAPFEAVADLLWTGRGVAGSVRPGWSEPLGWPGSAARLGQLLTPNAQAIDALGIAVPFLAQHDPMRYQTGLDVTRLVGTRLVRRLAASLALIGDDRKGASARVAEALACETVTKTLATALRLRCTRRTLDMLRATLIVCADHGLNPSSFAARITASAGADLYACTSAALATLSGPRHGGVPDRIASLIDEINRPDRTASVVQQRLRRGDEIPGFGHTIYPAGDPRAVPLLAAAQRMSPRRSKLLILRSLVDTMALAGAQPPTVDVGLAAVACALGLPQGGATALFAIGRSVGWIAQVLEQREQNFVLRPRARYVGVRADEQ